MDKQTEQILNCFLALEKLFSSAMKVYYNGRSLTIPQLLLLDRLDAAGPTQISHLAQLLSCSNSTISGILDRLESLELVRRSRISDDLRVVHVETTEKCSQLKESLGGRFGCHLAAPFATCSEADKAAILQGLELMERCLAK